MIITKNWKISSLKPVKISTASYYIFNIILACTLLNLNGFFYMAFGVGQVFSPIIYFSMLVIIFLLFISKEKLELNALQKLFLFSLVSFIILSSILYFFYNQNFSASQAVLLFAYFSSALLFYCSSVLFNRFGVNEFRNIENFLIVFMIINISMVPLSFFYRSHLINPPLEVARGFGMFANANEAGIFCCYSICYFLYKLRVSNRKIFFSILILLSWFSAVLTFSKSSIIVGTFTIILYLIFFNSKKSIFFIAILLPFFFNFDFLMLGNLLDGFGLSNVQQRRITQTAEIILSGEVNSDTTSARSILWQKGIDSIASHPFGIGIGELHHFKDFSNDFGEPQGVHNFFLMVFGEAGFLVFSLFVFFLMLVFALSFYRFYFRRLMGAYLTFSIFFVFFVDSIVGHNVLLVKFNIIFIALALRYFYFDAVKN